MNKPAPVIIRPTVGRVVWYYPDSGRDGPDFAFPKSGDPCKADICAVHSDRLVNLSVFDAQGRHWPRLSVDLVQDGDEKPAHAHCTFMPFQIGQARALAGQS